MAFNYDEFKRAYRRAKQNLAVSRQYITNRPNPIPTRIPVRGHFGRISQQGISKTHVSRRVELDAGKPQVIVKRVLLESEAEKRAAVLALWQEAADWSRKREGHGIYGGARHRWIAGKLGLTVREVCLLLGKNK